jgi:hypothetical protein
LVLFVFVCQVYNDLRIIHPTAGFVPAFFEGAIMALNLLASIIINDVKLSFGTNPEAEKFSLSVAIPSWPVEMTEGKGKNKKVVGIVDASFSKRSINDVGDFMDPRMPQDLFEGAVDRNLPGFRAFWRKNGLVESVATPSATAIKNDEGFLTGYENVSSVKEVISIVTAIMEQLTPKTGSVADPELEAKRIFAKSSEYATLNFEDPTVVFAAWKKTQLDNIERVMSKADKLTSEDFKTFCLSKFADNGTDEDGFLRLKAEKKAEK